MPRRLYPCTPSRLRAWLDCPRRYRMSYLDRPAPPKGPPWAHNSLGASVHNALAGWWRLRREERTPETAGALLERGWLSDGFADDARSSLALALYALAAGRVLRRPCRTVELHHLPTGKVLHWEHTPESLDRQLRRAEDIAGECAAAAG